MPRGGARPGAGKPRRIPNPDAISVEPTQYAGRTMDRLGRLVSAHEALPGAMIVDGELVMPKGWMLPLVYLAGILNNPGVDPNRRDRVANMMLPYLHSRMAEASKMTAKQKTEEQAKKAGDGTEWAGILRAAA
jgi:hypothetical protein